MPVATGILEILQDRRSSYSFLSRAYRQEMSLELLRDLRAADGFGGQGEGAGDGQRLLDQFIAGLRQADLSTVQLDLAVEYASLFLNAGRWPVFPYESVYTSPEHLIMQKARDEVVREYASEGLTRMEGFNEPEDHIAIELEFMAFLCQKASQALQQGDYAAALAALHKQEEFLEKHLSNWTPQFCEHLLKAAQSDFYRGVGALTRDLLTYDRQTLQELVEEVDQAKA